jgi:hypothetical protein
MLRLAVVPVLGLCRPALAAAQGKENKSEEMQTKVGVVRQVGVAGKKTVVMVPREMTFPVNGDTKIHRGGNDQRLADTKVDANVKVEYARTGDNRLAVELSDQIAAAGVVNGSLGIKSVDGQPVAVTIPEPVAPISVIHISGKKDTTVKFQGSQTPKNLFKSALDCIQMFVKANECTAPAKDTRDVAQGIVRTRYSGGKAGTEVELVVVENCGHEWPGDRHGLSASKVLWDFFSAHPKGTK